MEREGPGRYFREKRSSTLKAASLSYQAKGPPDFFFRWGAITAERSDGDGDENDDGSDDGGWWEAGRKGDVGGRERLVPTYLMTAQHGSPDRGARRKRSSAFIITIPRKLCPVSKARSIPRLLMDCIVFEIKMYPATGGIQAGDTTAQRKGQRKYSTGTMSERRTGKTDQGGGQKWVRRVLLIHHSRRRVCHLRVRRVGWPVTPSTRAAASI